MFVLHNGHRAPDISLPDARGGDWNLSDHAGKMVALYFCRGEYCPTTQGEFALWNSFSRLYPKMNCEMVFVVNGGYDEHARFAKEFRMRVPILVDHDGSIGEAYGVYGVNSRDMKRDDYKNYQAPAVYILDRDLEVASFWLASGPRGMPTPETLIGICAYAQNNGWKY